MEEHVVSRKHTVVLLSGALWVGGGVDAGQTKVCKSSRSEPNHESLYVVVRILDCVLQVTGRQ